MTRSVNLNEVPDTLKEAIDNVRRCYHSRNRAIQIEDHEGAHMLEDDAMVFLIQALLKRFRGQPMSPELRRAIGMVQEIVSDDTPRHFS